MRTCLRLASLSAASLALMLALAASAGAGGLEELEPATAFDHVTGTSGVVLVDLYAPW